VGEHTVDQRYKRGLKRQKLQNLGAKDVKNSKVPYKLYMEMMNSRKKKKAELEAQVRIPTFVCLTQ
jgi:hypothetical protein